MHLAHACNLRCEGCTHYSNYVLKGTVSFAEGGQWLRSWSRRISPLYFSFLGGEPLLNTELFDFLRLAREIWPETEVRLVTNGLRLDRWPGLWSVLGETKTRLMISIHSRDKVYQSRMRPILELTRSQAAAHGFAYDERNCVARWYKLYRGQGPSMEPFDDDNPSASWRVCQNKNCVTLQDNALWKCPPIAHLPHVAMNYNLSSKKSWQPYLKYKPLPLDVTDEEIMAFFSRRAESFCGMCPTRLEYFEKSIY